MKGLPLTYNRDLQEDKGVLFAAYDRLVPCLTMTARMIDTLKVHRERMLSATNEGFINATDLADHLVTMGLPFRQAHEAVGGMVRYAIDKGKRLDDLTLEEMRKYSGLVDKDVLSVIAVDKCVDRRQSFGGTSTKQAAAQFMTLGLSINEQERFVASERERIEIAFRALKV